MSLINVPKNFFEKNVFHDGMEEKHEYEQFFWTRDTVLRLMKACELVGECCCLTTPSLAQGFHEQGKEQVLLDIDERFNYLPRFRYYDVRFPYKLDETFNIFVLDPPFFVVPIEKFREAVDLITNKNYQTKLMIGFLKREERRLLTAFSDYKLRKTNCRLEYASIKENKWDNFALYSNIDLPGVKRVSKN